MNEPHYGFIGVSNLNKWDSFKNLKLYDAPSPLQSFALGQGIPQMVDIYKLSWPFPTTKSGKRIINEEEKSAWLDKECIWYLSIKYKGNFMEYGT